MTNSNFVDKSVFYVYIYIYIYIYILLCIKDEWKIYYQKNREVILSKDYCENNKEKVREQARNKYRNLHKEEKIKESMEKIDARRKKSNTKRI